MTTPPATPQAKKKATEYVVLQQEEEDPTTWIFVNAVEARSASEALRKMDIGKSFTAVYVAVPARSWNPVTVTVETTTTVKLS